MVIADGVGIRNEKDFERTRDEEKEIRWGKDETKTSYSGIGIKYRPSKKRTYWN